MIKASLHMKFHRQELLFAAFLFCFFIFTLASVLSEPLKYLKYTLPFLLFIGLVADSKRLFLHRITLKTSRRFRYLIGLITFYLAAFVINIYKGYNNLRFYEEFYFVLAPLFFAFFLLMLKPVEDYSKVVHFLFWSIAVSFVAEKFHYFIEEIKNPSLLIDAFLTSELPTESNFAFQFGLFAVVFLERKNKMYSILSVVLLLLSFKRIAIAGVLVFVLLLLFKRVAGKHTKLATNKTVLVVFNCCIVSLLFLFFSGTFDQLIEDTIGVSSNFLTQGRYNIYQDIFSHFGSISLLGFGLGSINSFLSSAGYELVNLHSDVLKVFFELGPLLFVGWIYFFHKWANTFLSSCLAIYVNILFFTDNVFIYFDVMFVFYMLMLYSFDSNKECGLHHEACLYGRQKVVAIEQKAFHE